MSWQPTVWINRSNLTTAPWYRHNLSFYTCGNLTMEKSGDWFKVTWLSSSKFDLTFLGKRLFKKRERTELGKAICPCLEQGKIKLHHEHSKRFKRGERSLKNSTKQNCNVNTNPFYKALFIRTSWQTFGWTDLVLCLPCIIWVTSKSQC